MMQMLEAGGIPAVTDGRRAADQHNPRGYFEDERARWLPQDSSWMAEACGKAVKVIYRLLPHLPPELEYRVLFMERDPGEVYDSQQEMLLAQGDNAAGQDRDSIVRALSQDLDTVRMWVAEQPNIRCFAVPYSELISGPKIWISQIGQFLDGGLDEPAMSATVDPALYRHRKL